MKINDINIKNCTLNTSKVKVMILKLHKHFTVIELYLVQFWSFYAKLSAHCMLILKSTDAMFTECNSKC